MTWKSSLVTDPLPSSRKVMVLLSAGLQQATIRLRDQGDSPELGTLPITQHAKDWCSLGNLGLHRRLWHPCHPCLKVLSYIWMTFVSTAGQIWAQVSTDESAWEDETQHSKKHCEGT